MITLFGEAQVLAVKLATERRSALRKEFNRQFMAHGTGPSWDAWKRANSALYDEEAVLSHMLGLDPVRGPQPTDQDRLKSALELLKQIDFSEWPGLYDSMPWAKLEEAAKS